MFWSKKDKTIGVFYICTGKYDIFWDLFYKSAEQYFCIGMKKHYFIFTDSNNIPKGNNITIIEQKKLGWPFDTLMRFHMFNRIKEEAIKCDYLFFFNANMEFLKKVTPKQILPNDTEQLVGVMHPFYYGGTDNAPFEINLESTAYTDYKKAKKYVAGGLSGGLSEYYMQMSDAIAANIDKDLEKNIIAIWHDESHINAYFSQRHHFKILKPGYIVPEDRLAIFPFKPKIIVVDKNKFGGLELIRS